MGSTYLFVISTRSRVDNFCTLVTKMRFISVLIVSLIIVINVYGSQSQKVLDVPVPGKISQHASGYCYCNDQMNFPQLCYCDDLGYQVCCPAYTYCCSGGSRCCVKKENPMARIFPSLKKLPISMKE